MRRVFSFVVAVAVVAACAKSETGASDSSAAAAMGPGMLTSAQLAGTWNGMSIPEGSDTATVRWTSVSTETGAEVKVVTQGQTDTVVYTRTLDADSLMATSAPFTPPQPPGSAQVINRAVGRLMDGKLVGTFVTTLAAQPDSVVMRGRWEATRAP